MTLNDLEWLFHVKMRFWPALLESERLNVKKIIRYNLCDSAVFRALHDQLASLGRHAQLTRYFSAVAELLVWIKGPLLLVPLTFHAFQCHHGNASFF